LGRRSADRCAASDVRTVAGLDPLTGGHLMAVDDDDGGIGPRGLGDRVPGTD
jgi:hypothetical protein